MSFASDLGVCVCNDNAVSSEGSCLACGADEVVVSNMCSCPAGTTKNAAGVCAEVAGLGTACDAANPCESTMYGFCWDHNGKGTCTQTCATDTDCPAAYTCADWEPTPYCRTFTGYGATCTTQEACSTFDADFCVQGRCVIQGCRLDVSDCPRGTQCCDFSNFGVGTLCAPPELCQ